MRILTHNVYWFQGQPPRWGIERVAEVPEVLAALTRLYRAVDADVVCLQEVHRPDLGAAVADALGMTSVLHAPGGLRADYGGVVMARGNARLRDCTRPEGAAPHDRVHMRVSVDWNGAPLEIAAVHLPSNRYAGSAEAGQAARLAELARVLADQPDLVVGDMNSRPDTPPCLFMREHGYLDTADRMGWGGKRFTEMPDGPVKSRVDYIWLQARHQDRLKSFSVLESGAFRQVEPDGTAWMLSDHPPLCVELQ